MAASQQYEQLSQQYEAYCTEEKLDELFLEAFQLLDIRTTFQRFMVKPSGKQQVDVEPLNNPVVVKPSGKPGFCQSQSEKGIQVVKSHAYRRRQCYKTLVHGLKAFGVNGLLTD